MTEDELRARLAAYDAILALRYEFGPCSCMGPQNGDPLCPCAMSAATTKTLREERDATLRALARASKAPALEAEMDAAYARRVEDAATVAEQRAIVALGKPLHVANAVLQALPDAIRVKARP